MKKLDWISDSPVTETQASSTGLHLLCCVGGGGKFLSIIKEVSYQNCYVTAILVEWECLHSMCGRMNRPFWMPFWLIGYNWVISVFFRGIQSMSSGRNQNYAQLCGGGCMSGWGGRCLPRGVCQGGCLPNGRCLPRRCLPRGVFA